jgi:MFS family permease
MHASASAPSEPRQPAASAYAWRLLAFLTGLNVLNFVDRWLISSLAPLLIADLGLTRAQIGLLVGFGFVLFYSVAGLLLGLAADRWPRIPLIAIGLTLWSAMTALSGWARSFIQLALPRIFVGAGEATLTPAALSMLADAFPRRRLAMATGVYYAGIPLGTAVSLIASSYIAPRWGWRACFFVLGGIGLVAVAGLLLFREPARASAAPAGGARPELRRLAAEATRALLARRELVLTLLGGSLLVYGASAGLHVVTWLVEERGYPFAEAAFKAGIVAVFAGFFGNLAGGALGDWFARRWANGHLWSLVAMTAFLTPLAAGFYLLPRGTPLFYVCWFFTAASSASYFGPLFATIQELAPAHLRSTAVAFALLVMNLLGIGPGPLITGKLGDERGLTFGLLSSLVPMALAIVPFVLAARTRAAGTGNLSSFPAAQGGGRGTSG